jgi:hypothetical protein
MPALKHEKFINKVGVKEGFGPEIDIALANRPLNGITHECPCKMASRNDLSSVKPYYSETDIVVEVVSDGGREVPVIIQKSREQYLVLEKKADTDTDDSVYVDSWGDLPVNGAEGASPLGKIKLDSIAQFYIASLSVIALFVVFRMIQKTK